MTYITGLEYVVAGILGACLNVLYTMYTDANPITSEDYKKYIIKVGVGATIGLFVLMGIGSIAGLVGLGGAIVGGYLGLDILDTLLKTKNNITG